MVPLTHGCAGVAGLPLGYLGAPRWGFKSARIVEIDCMPNKILRRHYGYWFKSPCRCGVIAKSCGNTAKNGARFLRYHSEVGAVGTSLLALRDDPRSLVDRPHAAPWPWGDGIPPVGRLPREPRPAEEPLRSAALRTLVVQSSHYTLSDSCQPRFQNTIVNADAGGSPLRTIGHSLHGMQRSSIVRNSQQVYMSRQTSSE